jgi:predicted small integral membrane protein
MLFVAYIGLFAVIVVLNNVTDYQSNFRLTQNVMGMDTTFPDNKLRWRAIRSVGAHHAVYWLIIALEATAGLLCLWGAFELHAVRDASVQEFHAAKSTAFVGLAAGFTVWFALFMIGAGQWFASWQSKEWNGQDAAFRFYMPIAAVFVILLHPA